VPKTGTLTDFSESVNFKKHDGKAPCIAHFRVHAMFKSLTRRDEKGSQRIEGEIKAELPRSPMMIWLSAICHSLPLELPSAQEPEIRHSSDSTPHRYVMMPAGGPRKS
jgi:hypothetical protein